MRTVFFLLLLANIILFAYTRLDSAAGGEAARLAEQVQPDKIRLLTPQQVAALGPAKVASLADVCLEWGPFNDNDRIRALADLDSPSLGRLLTQKRVESSTSHWISLPRTSNKANVERRVAELKAAGVKDVTVVESNGPRYTIALGYFRTEAAAAAALTELRGQKIGDAQVSARQQVTVQATLVIRDPAAPLVAKVRALQPSYAGTEIKTGACDKPN